MQLIGVTYTDDDLNQKVPTETSRAVYCNVGSVSGEEYFEAGRNGIHAAYRVTMFAPDYNGEKIAMIGNKRFYVYRTYRGKNDMIDLYLEERGGV